MVACTQDHWTIENPEGEQAHERHVVRAVTLAELAKDPEAVQRMGEEPARARRCTPSTSTRGTPGACRST